MLLAYHGCFPDFLIDGEMPFLRTLSLCHYWCTPFLLYLFPLFPFSPPHLGFLRLSARRSSFPSNSSITPLHRSSRLANPRIGVSTDFNTTQFLLSHLSSMVRTSLRLWISLAISSELALPPFEELDGLLALSFCISS